MGRFLDWLSRLFSDRRPGPLAYAYTDSIRNDLAIIIGELEDVNAKLDRLLHEHDK